MAVLTFLDTSETEDEPPAPPPKDPGYKPRQRASTGPTQTSNATPYPIPHHVATTVSRGGITLDQTGVGANTSMYRYVDVTPWERAPEYQKQQAYAGEKRRGVLAGFLKLAKPTTRGLAPDGRRDKSRASSNQQGFQLFSAWSRFRGKAIPILRGS
jgi:hypothetical protein